MSHFYFLPGVSGTHLKEEVDKVRVLLQFGTDYTKELNLLVLCGSSQHLPTQADQFLTEECHSKTRGKKRQLHNPSFKNFNLKETENKNMQRITVYLYRSVDIDVWQERLTNVC